MAGPAESQPVTFTGAQIAIFLSGSELPVSKAMVKKTAKKTEVTGSTSGAVVGGVSQIWQEFSPAPSGGTFEAEGHWRVGQAIAPPMMRQGALYPVLAYVRRPGWNNAIDPGSAFSATVFVDDNNLTLDPNSGSIDWRLTGTFSGPILDPA